MAKTMAEVLAEHELAIDYAEYFACTCGRVQLAVNGDHNLHVAQELEAAGYGLVADAAADAWAEGHVRGFWNGRMSQLTHPL